MQIRETNINSIDLNQCEFSVLDFETTGTSSKTGKVIEIGIVKVKNFDIIENYSTLINPGIPIPWFITNLTGIANDDLYNAPHFEEIAEEILDFIDESVITAHNIPFDYNFLKKELTEAEKTVPPNPTLCTLQMARKLLPHIPSKSLGNVARYLRIQHKNIHRALGDATVTAKILIRFLKMLREDYGVDTLNDLLTFQGTPKSKTMTLIKKSLASDFASLPSSPGVYFFKNRSDEIIYIGKAKSIKDRVKNYFYSNAGSKAKKIVRRSSNLSFEKTGSELSALIAETELIKKNNPPMNVQLKSYPHTYFIAVEREDNYPKPKATSKFEFDGKDYFGPYNNRDTVKTLTEIIDKTFLLRECSDKEFAKGKKCYLYDIKRCIAPCILNDKQREYESETDKVYQFLSGINQVAVDRLLHKMKKLSEEKRFEDAAEIRDTTNLLLEQFNKAAIINGPVNKANALIQIKSSRQNDLLLLIEGRMLIKDFFLDERDYFDTALKDYYSGTIKLFENLSDKYLERLKISLNWLVKNRNIIKVYYLDDFNSQEELFTSVGDF